MRNIQNIHLQCSVSAAILMAVLALGLLFGPISLWAQAPADCSSLNPSAPAGVYSASISAQSAEIHWQPVNGSAGYIVSWGVRSLNPRVWASFLVCSPDTFLNIIGSLAPGVEYGVRVRANCDNCTTAYDRTDKRSGWSEIVYFTALSSVNASISSTAPACNSGTDGSISLTGPSGGGGTYEYSTNGGDDWSVDSVFSGLPAGSYDVRVRDAQNPANEVVLNASYALTAPGALSASVSALNASDCMSPDGGIGFSSASGGSGNYQYSIDGGAAWQTSPLFQNLNTGQYRAFIRDQSAANCQADLGNHAVAGPSAPAVPSASDITALYNEPVSVSASGSAPYFEWFDAPVLGNSLGTGASLNLGGLTSDRAVWVEGVDGAGCRSIGREKALITISGGDVPGGPGCCAQACSRPRSFVHNKGQLVYDDFQPASDVLYFADLNEEVSVYLKEDGLSYVFKQFDLSPDRHLALLSRNLDSATVDLSELRDSATVYRIDMEFTGANSDPLISPQSPRDYKQNYQLGYLSAPVQNVSSFQKIYYEDVYPNIDWTIYFTDAGELKYDFIVHPGGDPNDIEMSYTGLDTMYALPGGQVSLNTCTGCLSESKPFTFQRDQNGRVQPVSCEYLVSPVMPDPDIKYSVGTYDPNRPLIIDPYLTWATYSEYRGPWLERFVSVDTDADDNFYVLGNTYDGNLIPAQTGTQKKVPLSLNYFILKHDVEGRLLSTVEVGGRHEDIASELEVDQNGDVWVIGSTHIRADTRAYRFYGDFPLFNNQIDDYRQVNPYVYNVDSTDDSLSTYAAFVAHHDAADDTLDLLYSTCFSTHRHQSGVTLACDPTDNSIWIAGVSYDYNSRTFFDLASFSGDVCSATPPFSECPPANRKPMIANSFNHRSGPGDQGYLYVAFIFRLNNDKTNLCDSCESIETTKHGGLRYFAQVSGNRVFNMPQDIEISDTGHVWLLGATNSDACISPQCSALNVCCPDSSVLGCPSDFSLISNAVPPLQACLRDSCHWNGNSYCNDTLVRCHYCNTDLFLMKFHPDDTLVHYFTYLGGTEYEGLYDLGSRIHQYNYLRSRISIGKSNGQEKIWLAATTLSLDITDKFRTTDSLVWVNTAQQPNADPTLGAQNRRQEGILLRFASDGAFEYGSYLGGPSSQYLTGLQATDDGRAWVGGTSFFDGAIAVPSGSSADTTAPYYQSVYDWSRDNLFLALVDSDGTFDEFTHYGGQNEDVLCDLALNGRGEVLLAGFTNSYCLAGESRGLPLYKPEVPDAASRDVYFNRTLRRRADNVAPEFSGLLVRFSPVFIPGENGCCPDDNCEPPKDPCAYVSGE